MGVLAGILMVNVAPVVFAKDAQKPCTVGKPLADNCSQFSDFVRLAAADKKFQNFVLRHVDETTPADTLKKVAQNAGSHCPAAPWDCAD
jgi:hypothetical protein